MPINHQNLDQALQLLGDLLASWKVEDFQLVVCGGSALLAQKIISRATHDVDVLAQRNWDHEISRAHPLPETLIKAAQQVAEELGLKPNWLNSAASFHFPDFLALPASFWTDLETRDYGSHLRVSFVNRSGQILLKLYAALNRAEARDFDDLRSLAPDADETESGLHWLIRSFPGLTHLDRIPELLTHLGHADLIHRFQK
jgi:hypothetical protein